MILLQPRYSGEIDKCFKQFESNIIDLPSLSLMSVKFLKVSVRVCDIVCEPDNFLLPVKRTKSYAFFY